MNTVHKILVAGACVATCLTGNAHHRHHVPPRGPRPRVVVVPPTPVVVTPAPVVVTPAPVAVATPVVVTPTPVVPASSVQAVVVAPPPPPPRPWYIRMWDWRIR